GDTEERRAGRGGRAAPTAPRPLGGLAALSAPPDVTRQRGDASPAEPAFALPSMRATGPSRGAARRASRHRSTHATAQPSTRAKAHAANRNPRLIPRVPASFVPAADEPADRIRGERGSGALP